MATSKKSSSSGLVIVRAVCDVERTEFGHAGCLREGMVSAMSSKDAEAAVATGDFEYVSKE